MTRLTRVLAPLALLVPLVAAGCESENPSGPSAGGVPVIETFIGTLQVGSSAFYSFTVPNEGDVSLTLVELGDGMGPGATIVGLGIGSPLGTGCTAGVSISTGAGSRAQLTQTMTPGVYCAKVSDTGQITIPVNFALNISRPR
jgi:hypothetical protein